MKILHIVLEQQTNCWWAYLLWTIKVRQGCNKLQVWEETKALRIVAWFCAHRVHYPLPLLYEENPEPEALKRTIRRLRDELEEVKSTLQKKLEQTHPPLLNDEDSIQSIDSGNAELPKLREENARLKAQVQSYFCLQFFLTVTFLW